MPCWRATGAPDQARLGEVREVLRQARGRLRALCRQPRRRRARHARHGPQTDTGIAQRGPWTLMAISRRAFGLGLLATAAVGTGGYLALRDRPELQGPARRAHHAVRLHRRREERVPRRSRRHRRARRHGAEARCSRRRLGRDGARAGAAVAEAAIPVAVVVDHGRPRPPERRRHPQGPGRAQLADRRLHLGAGGRRA